MTTAPTGRRPRRPGFTLVELMVSAAVCVIIMTILAVAFQSGIDTMRTLKSVGDLQDQLRAARGTMERDLDTAHFEETAASAFTGPRLSDQQVDKSGYTANRPKGGFFRIQGTSSNAPPVQDSDTLEFDNTAPQIDHLLHFTSQLPTVVKPGEKDPDPTQWYRAQVNAGASANVKFSPWAEIAYFLDQQPTSSTPPTLAAPTGVKLYKLIRRQRLIAQSAVLAPDLQPPNIEQNTGFDLGVVALKKDPTGTTNAGKYNTACLPSDLVVLSAGNRLGGATVDRNNGDEKLGSITDTVPDTGSGTNTGRGRIGDDVLLTNVLLFEVRATWAPGSGSQAPRPFTPPSASTPKNTHDPFDVIAWAKPAPPSGATATAGVFFDTGGDSADTKYANVRVNSLKITIRIFDPNTNTARQTTINCNP